MTIVGDGAVGKTTLVRAMLDYTDGKVFNHEKEDLINIKRTPFMEIESWDYEDLKIQCFDLAGQRNIGSHPLDILRDQVVSSIDIYIFVFALNRFESFEHLNYWVDLCFEEEKNSYTNFILVGNKSDLERTVSKELIDSLVGSNQFFDKYVETCAIDSTGIEELLDSIVELGKNLLNSD